MAERARRPQRPSPEARFTRADLYRTVMSVVMVLLGIVILARALGLGVHPMALLLGCGFIALGAYRLSFVVAYLRQGKS